jgi:hypothetical protein
VASVAYVLNPKRILFWGKKSTHTPTRVGVGEKGFLIITLKLKKYLGSGFSGSLGFCGHSALQLNGQTSIFAVKRLNVGS